MMVCGMPKRLLFLFLLAGAPVQVLALDTGTTVVTTVLRQTPEYTAAVLGTLPRGTPLQILKRDGSWFQVRPAGKDASGGWVRMFDIRLQAARKSSRGGGLSRLFSFFRRDRGAPRKGVTSTIGIRGLGASDLQTARPNRRELARMDAYRSSGPRAIGFAVQGRLPERRLDYFQDGSTARTTTPGKGLR